MQLAQILDALPSMIFWVFAAVTVLSAATVVLSKSLIHSAFALLGTFFGVAGLYVFLGADFLAGSQVLIYVGGILILLLFGVMLTRRSDELSLAVATVQFQPGLLLASLIFATLCLVAVRAPWHKPDAVPERLPTTHAIGNAFLGEQLLPFEASSVLLLVALVGAATLVRRETRREESR
ncbi:MAG: NADH-quinone oxidoreductase subunit J [Acidobacteriota bacterium]